MFAQLRIGARLGVAFIAVCLCMLAATAIGVLGRQRAGAATERLAAAGALRRDAMTAKLANTRRWPVAGRR